MSNNITRFFFFVIISCFAFTTQAQTPCAQEHIDVIRENLENALSGDQPDVETALQEITALRACDTSPGSRNYIDEQYNRIIQISKQVAIEANKLRIIAEEEAQRAADALSLAESLQKTAEKAEGEAEEAKNEALVKYYMSAAQALVLEANSSNDYHQKAIQITTFVHNHLDAEHPQVKQMIMHLFHLTKRRNIKEELHLSTNNEYYYDYEDLLFENAENLENLEDLENFQEEYLPTLSKVAAAPHLPVIAIASYFSSSIRIWDSETNNSQQLHFNTAGLDVADIAWSLDGNYLAAVASNTLFVWSSQNWLLQKIIPLNNYAHGLTLDWSVENDLAVGKTDGTVSVFSEEHFELQNTFHLHSDYVRSVSWSPDGKQLLTTSDDYTIYLLDVDAEMIIYEKTDFTDWVRAGDWHPETNQILVGDDGGELTIIDYDNDTAESTADDYGMILNLEFSRDGHSYAFINDLGFLMVHDAQRHQVIQSFYLEGLPLDFTWSAGDSILWVLIENSPKLTSYSLHSGEKTDYDLPKNLTQTPRNVFLQNDEINEITAVAWDPSNENRLAAGDMNGNIRIFLDNNSQSLDTIMAFHEKIAAIAWGDKGLLAVADAKRVSIWNINTKTMVHVIPFWNPANAVGWSTSGAFLAVGDQAGNLSIWRTSTWELVEQRQLSLNSIMALDWANLNNKLLAVGTSSGQGLVIDLDKPKPILFAESHTDWIRDIEWLPGDSLIVSSGDDYQTAIWKWDYGPGKIDKKAAIYDHLGYHLSVDATNDNTLLHIGVGLGQVSAWDISDSIPQKVGYVVQPDIHFIDITATPAHNRIAATATGGGPLFYNSYDLQPSYKPWSFNHTEELASADSIVEQNDLFNEYLYSSWSQFLWLDEEQKHAVVPKGEHKIMIYDYIGDQTPDTLMLPPKVGKRELLTLYANETKTHLIATTDSTVAYIWPLGKIQKPPTILSTEDLFFLKQMTANRNGTLVGGIDFNGTLFVWELNAAGRVKDRSLLKQLTIEGQALEFLDLERGWRLEVTQGLEQQLYKWGNKTITIDDTSVASQPSDVIIGLRNTNRNKEYYLLGYTNHRKLNLEQQTIEDITFRDLDIDENIFFAQEQNFLAILEAKLFDADNHNSFLKVWDLSSSTVELVQEFKETRGHYPITLKFSEGKKYLVLSSVTTNNEYFLWIWECDKNGDYQLLSKESHQANRVDISPDGNFVLTHSEPLERIDFWSVSKDKNLRALSLETTGHVLAPKDILEFNLEEIFSHNVQNSINVLQQSNNQQQIANWATYLLEEGKATTVKSNKEQYFKHALTLLQQHPEFTYGRRSPLHSLYADANISYGKFLQRESRSRDSISNYYRRAIALGGVSDPSIIANIALVDWQDGNKKVALNSIFNAQNSSIVLELQDSIQSIFENQKNVWQNDDTHDFLRIVYLDNIPLPLRKQFDLPSFELESPRSMANILTPINAQGSHTYLLHYYQQNARNFIFDRDERIYFAEQGVALIESTDDKSEDHSRRLLTLQHVLVSAYKEKKDLIRAHEMLSSSLETARSVYRQININQPGFAPIFKQETLMPLFVELAYLELLQNKDDRAAEDLLNKANNDFNIDDSPSMLIQRGHIELFNNNFDGAIQEYLKAASEDANYRGQIYQEIIALDLKNYLKAVGNMLRPG